MSLLEINNLHVQFETRKETVYALNGVSLEVEENQVLGVIGESGCGKSVTALTTMGLLDSPPGRVTDGEILFRGENLLEMSERELNRIRGNKISMIYQDPMEALNPSLTIGDQVTEPILAHTDISKADARTKAIETLEECELADPERILDEYPHSLSGGMQQRVMIAMAVITEPDLLIADEPTTALDVTIQAQIMDLLNDLRDSFNTSMLFITHDIPVITEIAEVIAVMYAGKVAEMATIEQFLDNPLHPYTQRLMDSLPKVSETQAELPVIDGVVPTFNSPPTGCVFASRCPEHLGPKCDEIVPEPQAPTPGETNHDVACHLYDSDGSDTERSNQPSTVAASKGDLDE